MKYYKTPTGEVFAFENDGSQDQLIKPDYEALTDYAPPQCADTVPQEVPMRQARLALLAAGLLDQVDAAIAAMPEPQKKAASIEWEYSNALQRSNPFVAQLGAALGLDESVIDDLFVAAAKL